DGVFGPLTRGGGDPRSRPSSFSWLSTRCAPTSPLTRASRSASLNALASVGSLAEGDAPTIVDVEILDDLSGRGPDRAVKTLIHELGHALPNAEGRVAKREVAEVEVESVAFIVCDALSLDSGK
ncbi:MAG: hypothetical protein M3214_02505, partial [Actinomycetota bacterium]|nr:hypothetical protein [Actinomycetota bacterium]